jgi:hypothetical protein
MGRLGLEMLVEEGQDERPEVFLLRLQMERVRGAFHNFQVVLNAFLLERGGQDFGLANGNRRIGRSMKDEKRRIVFVEIRERRERAVELRRLTARLS